MRSILERWKALWGGHSIVGRVKLEYTGMKIGNLFAVPLVEFRLRDKTSFRFLAVVDDEHAEPALAEARERLQAILRDKEMDNVQFEIERVAELPVDPHTGKFRLVVDDS